MVFTSIPSYNEVTPTFNLSPSYQFDFPTFLTIQDDILILALENSLPSIQLQSFEFNQWLRTNIKKRRDTNQNLSMELQFRSIALAEIQPTLQRHVSALSSPIDSFLEDHILASNHYEIRSSELMLGWTSIHGESLITQFALLPAYRHLGQAIFAQVRKLEMVRSAFVPTCDEFFLAHALDDYRQLEKQAYFFQHNEQREPYQSPLALRYRQASRKDIPTIQQLSGDFFDKLEERIDDGQIYISERERPVSGEIVGFGIIDKGRLCLGVASCGMFVVESARRQGIGAAIIASLMRRCAELNLRPVAGCWVYNHNSKKTLEKAGMFTQTRLLRISY